MQFPESWLREFCDPPISTAELAQRLTMAGLEVEAMRPAAPPFHGVVVAEVLAVEPHPNADRLRVCRVDAGSGETLGIVCGAPNVRAGIKVPLARIGAELPPAQEGGGAFRIEVGTIRGVESRGMLCSARELKLSDDHGGLFLLDDAAPVGTDLREFLNLDDTIFTLKLTPNLGHCLSVYGVAREVAALTGAPLKAPPSPTVEANDDTVLRVSVEASDLCGRFSGRVVRNIDTQAKTPAWMADRLARCGQRTVGPLVDISNYVMFESGQPSHIFDLDAIEGGLQVRWARPGETLELLNGSTVELDAKVGVIADDVRVESLAGIMGGARTAVSDTTTNVYVEAAFWWPEAVAGRSRRYRFTTDAGHRFERGVDPAATVRHIERITALIVEICGPRTRCGPVDDHVVHLPQAAPVTLRFARAAKIIGLPLTPADCEGVMTRLGFAWTRTAGAIQVVPPSWRFDIRLEEDLIEEVIRLIGYDALDAAPPLGRIEAKVPSESRRTAAALRHEMADLGWQETISFSFVDARWERDFAANADPVRVVNPIAATQSVMRSSLLGSLVEVLRVNVARKASRLRVFELGKVYIRDAGAAAGEVAVAGVRQPLRLGGLAFGPAVPLQWGSAERPVDFFDVKGDLESLFGGEAGWRFVPAPHPALHPGRSAAIERHGERVGFIGEVHPRWRQAYEMAGHAVVFEIDAEALLRRPLPALVPLPKQQPVWRDIAIVARRSVTHDALIGAVEAAASGVVRAATLFDVYEPKSPVPGIGDDERSMALRLELRDDAQTLTDEHIDGVVAGVVASLRERLGARLRAQ
jgi:phenylalanyl-tRNA synthetase beta chain